MSMSYAEEGSANFIIVGTLVHSEKISALTIIENGFICVVRGKIVFVSEDLENLEKAQQKHGIGKENVHYLQDWEFVMPGFIDTHIHSPQYPNLGLGYDKELLEWLPNYTYPLEMKFSDNEFSLKVNQSVVRKSLDYGTTTAAYFETKFYESSLILADVAERLGQRAFVGKVNMNSTSFEVYHEETDESLTLTEQFIRYVLSKKNGLVQPIITPRSALCCDMEIMKALSALASKYALNIQTHVAENLIGIERVKQLHPGHKHETHVYNKAGLLTKRTVLAHGVHLQDDELNTLVTKRSSIAHCPNSNTSLKSGLCDVRRLLDAGLNVGLGTDVAGGSSISMLNAIRSALQTSAHVSVSRINYSPLTYHEVVYLATLGGAKALSIEHKTGSFETGKDFDALLVNMSNYGQIDILDMVSSKALFEKFIFCGDDRNIRKVFVAGVQVK